MFTCKEIQIPNKPGNLVQNDEGRGYYLGECNSISGNFEGKGALLFPDGSLYEGNLSHNLPFGQGRMIYPDGSYYKGQWLDGLRHGNGEF